MPSNPSPTRRVGTDSLATHRPGSSFAQKARAAELKAARARTHAHQRRVREESATFPSRENDDDENYIGDHDDGGWEEPRSRMLLPHGNHPLGPREVSLDEFRVVKRVRTKKGKGGAARVGAHAREESLVSANEAEGAGEDSGTAAKVKEIGEVRILKPEDKREKSGESVEMKNEDTGVIGVWKHDKFDVESEGETGTGGSNKKMVMTEGIRGGNFTGPNLDHHGQTFQSSALTDRNTNVLQPHHQQILTGHSSYQQSHAHGHPLQEVYASPFAQQHLQPTSHAYTYDHQQPSLLNTNAGFSPQLYPNYSRTPLQNQSIERHRPTFASQNLGQSPYNALPTHTLDPVQNAYVSPYAHLQSQQPEQPKDTSTAQRLRPGPGVTAYQRFLAENACKAAEARANNLTAKGTTALSENTQAFEGLCFSPPPVSEVTGVSENSTRPPSSSVTPDLGFNHPKSGFDMSRHTSYASHAKENRKSQTGTTTRDSNESGYTVTGFDGMDDPFVAQYQHPNAYTSDNEMTIPTRANVRMPPAVKGTARHTSTGHEPGSLIAKMQRATLRANAHPMSNLPTLAGQVTKRPEEYAEIRAMNGPRRPSLQTPTVLPTPLNGPTTQDQVSPATPRDPHPYTGFTAPASKTQMLMQTVGDTYNTDNTSSGRTVLYDPGPSQLTTRNTSLTSTSNGAAGNHRPSFLDLTHGHESGYEDPLNTSTTVKGVYHNGNYVLRSAHTDTPNRVGETDQANMFPNTNPPAYVNTSSHANTGQVSSSSSSEASVTRYDSGFSDYDTRDVELTPDERAKRDWEWFTAPNPAATRVKNVIETSYSHLAPTHFTPITPGSRNLRIPPIGSGRRGVHGSGDTSAISASRDSKPEKERLRDEQAAAVAMLAPAISNMAIHRDNDHRNPFTQYEDPPAWCVDNTETSPSSFTGAYRGGGNTHHAGNGAGWGYGGAGGGGAQAGGVGGAGAGYRSLLGENEWNPPRRVGRDPRYPVSYLDGRVTRFEDVSVG